MATRLSKLLIAAPVVFSCGMIGSTSIYAQVETDGTVGPRLQLDGPEFAIRADLGTRAGRNLFHSFERFSLGSGERATFTGPNQIRNVLSRVTGGARSDIDGTIRSIIPGADFYFLNPAGVVFGPNASLDLQGSFHVSTADELRFADGANFSASNPAASSFTVARPEAFGFLRGDRGALRVADSRLRVRAGEAISLVGGEVNIAGGSADADNPTIGASRGTITVGAVGVGGGQSSIRSGQLEAPDRNAITVTDGTFMDASGDGGGTVRVRGGNFVVDRSLIDASNFGDRPGHGSIDVRLVGDLTLSQSLIGAGSSGSGSGGTVEIAAANITLSDGLLNSNSLLGAGNAGSVTVTADRLTLLEGSQISSSTGQGSTGAGGEVQVTARESLLIAGRNARDGPSGIFASTEGAANSDRAAGNVTVTAGDLEIRDGLITSTTLTAGDAGSVTVTADRLTLLEGGQISSSPLFESTGAGGEVQVTARDSLLIAGRNARNFPSGIFATAEGATNSDKAAGNVIVTAGDLEIRDGRITSSTLTAGDAGSVTVTVDRLTLLEGGQISSSPVGESTGAGGEVQVTARESLLIAGRDADDFPSGIFASAEGAANSVGAAGDVTVTVTAGDLEIRDGGVISSAAFRGGDAGKVTVEADRLVLDRAAITTSSASAGGGEIQLLVGDVIDLRDSEIITSVAGGNDPTAGNIRIDPTVLIIDGSRIQANAPVGFGGRVTIVADNILVPGGDFEALLARREISATGGDPTRAGTIAVNAPEVDLSAGLVVVEGAFIDTAPLRERCGARRDIGASSFTGVGRGGLPPSPDGPLASAYVVDEAAVAEAQKAGSRRTAGIAPTNVRLVGLRAPPCVPLD